MVDILISPAEECGGFVVLLDVAQELSGQVGGGSENSPGNHIALNFGKPDFDLIEPARIGRSVMDPNGWIGLGNSKTFLVLCALKLSTTM